MAINAHVGQYQEGSSLLHKLDPRVKLVGALLFMISCFFITSPVSLLLACAATYGMVYLSEISPRLLIKQIKPLAIFLVFTSLINLFFVSDGTLLIHIGPLAVHTGGLAAALLYTIRFVLLLIAGELLMFTTTPIALADAAERLLSPLERIGVPVGQGVLILLIALRFVPTLGREVTHIVDAQTARGADLENKHPIAYARACVPLIVPLFASALRHAENLGRAMDARCYTGEKRTHYHVMRINPNVDYPALALVVLYIVLLLALKILL